MLALFFSVLFLVHTSSAKLDIPEKLFIFLAWILIFLTKTLKTAYSLLKAYWQISTHTGVQESFVIMQACLKFFIIDRLYLSMYQAVDIDSFFHTDSSCLILKKMVSK